MYLPGTYLTALVMTVCSSIFWGSWANTYKGTKNYRFELFYWDYIAGVVLVSLLFAFTLGSTGTSGEPFLLNLRRGGTVNLVDAFAGGFIFNIANLLLVAGMDLVGLSVAFPVSIGIAVIEGVALSYILQPKGNLAFLAGGVALALAAIVLDALAYSSLQKQRQVFSRKGIAVSVVSGILMGAFAPFVTRALTHGHKLTPYTIVVLFSLGAMASCFVFNVYLMRHPLAETPVDFSGFWRARGVDHLLGLGGGIVWGMGTAFNFVAAGFAGVAIAYAIGQSSPMIAALWGVFAWKEFAGAGGKARAYLALMFVFYIAAVVLIANAYQG
jgi:glucose uptake protein